MKKQVDPRVSAAIAAERQRQLIIQANMQTSGKHNGSKRKKTLLHHAHNLNNKTTRFYNN